MGWLNKIYSEQEQANHSLGLYSHTQSNYLGYGQPVVCSMESAFPTIRVVYPNCFDGWMNEWRQVLHQVNGSVLQKNVKGSARHPTSQSLTTTTRSFTSNNVHATMAIMAVIDAWPLSGWWQSPDCQDALVLSNSKQNIKLQRLKSESSRTVEWWRAVQLSPKRWWCSKSRSPWEWSCRRTDRRERVETRRKQMDILTQSMLIEQHWHWKNGAHLSICITIDGGNIICCGERPETLLDLFHYSHACRQRQLRKNEDESSLLLAICKFHDLPHCWPEYCCSCWLAVFYADSI